MSPPDLLLLSTYPIVKPRHGGQLRARALAEAYAAGGFKVTSVAVIEKGAWPKNARGPHDVEFPVDDPHWFIGGRQVPLCADVRSGVFAAQSETHYQAILASLPAKVSAIHLEQPFLLPLARRIMSEPRHAKAVLVYGSANIEAPLREAIFRQLEVADAADVVQRVLAVEQEAARRADLTLAVAPFDAETLATFGARQVLRAPNGIDAWKASPGGIARWTERFKAHRRLALFVASAHPPNYDGFLRAFGDSLGFVPPDCRIVVAGSVGSHLLEAYSRARFNTLNLSRLEFVGELDDDDLASLKTLTSVFLLPIFEGGGSNIKTAEAFYSGKSVIATPVSLRGFDGFTSLPQLKIANTRDEFRTTLRHLLMPGTALPAASPADAPLREHLLWKNCLAPVPPAVHRLLAER